MLASIRSTEFLNFEYPPQHASCYRLRITLINEINSYCFGYIYIAPISFLPLIATVPNQSEPRNPHYFLNSHIHSKAPEYLIITAQDIESEPEETQQRGNVLLTVIDETVYRKDPISRFMSSNFSTLSRADPDDSSSLRAVRLS